MQANRLPLDRLILDIDELNQHAPRRATSPDIKMIAAKLQDISERARTDGIILLAAQQTLSEVDEWVEANIATRCYGMMGEQEARQSVYGLSELERFVVSKLEPGEMLVQHPVLRHRVKVRVPRPTFLPGKAGQALLRPVAPEDFAKRLHRIMAGGKGRALPPLNQVRSLVRTVIENGGSLDDLEQAAWQVAQVAPLPDERNTGQATLNLFRKIVGERTGLNPSDV